MQRYKDPLLAVHFFLARGQVIILFFPKKKKIVITPNNPLITN